MTQQHPGIALAQWQYMTLTRRTESFLIKDLNDAGKEGWELVSITYHREVKGQGETMCWTAFMKRPCTAAMLAQAEADADANAGGDLLQPAKRFEAAQFDAPDDDDDDIEEEFKFADE